MSNMEMEDKNSQVSAFGNEEVHFLDCVFCSNRVCERGLRSFLIADEKVELYSTDNINKDLVDLTNERFQTDRCNCHIQNVACLQCGNVVGYHVSKPCRSCLEAQNNGHYWMFYRNAIVPYQRLNAEGTSTLIWGDLTEDNKLEESFSEYWGECER